MTISTKYKTNEELFGLWQKTQVSFFKKLMGKVSIDFMKAGKVFSNLADELNQIPTFKQFEEKYNEND